MPRTLTRYRGRHNSPRDDEWIRVSDSFEALLLDWFVERKALDALADAPVDQRQRQELLALLDQTEVSIFFLTLNLQKFFVIS